METQRDSHNRILVTSRHRGEPVQNLDMFTRAWDECDELRCQPKDVWVSRSLLILQEMDRYELGVLDGSGNTLGGILLAHDPWDVHVGPCMSVFSQYVLPEHRNAGISPMLMRAAIKIAKKELVTTLAFTHRKGPWRYETIYRRL